ncbi:MAG: HisA/HisF-related TIM barrel protein [Chlorobi bacterium]|nr:HisA/HisF-related TIM barrel protein [Chlorobiota bacterium]
MILIIPALEIRSGRCRRSIQGDPALESYYARLQEEPAEMALLLRRENARTIHVVDLDALDHSPSEANRKAIESIIDAVDIPIELLSKFDDPDTCQHWLRRGAFRLVLSDLIVTAPEQVFRLVERYSASRLVLGIRAVARRVQVGQQVLMDVELARQARDLGIRRVVYSDVGWEGTYDGPDFELIEEFARTVQMSITVAGGIDSPEELWRCNSLQSVGVDSVIVGRALAENRFPCQHIWRMVEAETGKKIAPSQKST